MKIYLFIVFTFLSINIFANEEIPHKMKNGRGHRERHYTKEVYEEENLTPMQKEQVMSLRVEYMDKERFLMERSKDIRREMNHCMREDDEGSNEKYHNLRMEREDLRKKMNKLRKEYKDNYKLIIKKQ